MSIKVATHLRICYWTGALADGLSVLSMGYFQLYRSPLEAADYVSDKYTSLALMAGWTCLLLWADRKPMERKGILILTVFPVLATLIGTELLGMARGVVEDPLFVPVILLQALLSIYFILAYHWARKDEKLEP